jgi:hypothetical protein
VGVFDADDAGRKGAARVRDSIARARGHRWARPRWRTLLLGADFCELHHARELASVLGEEPWTGQDVDPLWADVEDDMIKEPG